MKTIAVVGGIIRRGERYLLGKRPLGKSQGGRREFIGGKIEPGETREQALARECVEEILLQIINAHVRTSVTRSYLDRTIHLTLIDCEPAAGCEPTAARGGRRMRAIIGVVSLIAAILCGCAKDDGPDTFTVKEAEACLTASDYEVINRACAKVRAYDAAVKNGSMTEAIDNGLTDAIEELKDLTAQISNEGDTPTNNRRHAAVNWTLVATTFNRFNGTCACQVLFAANRGLIEAKRLVENPPRGLTTYLLPPGDPRRIEDE